MPLSDVLYQDDAQHQLQRALRSGRVPHAYLFAGPPGVGKEMLATRLAQVLLCSHSGIAESSVIDDAAPKPTEASPVADESPGLFGPVEDEPSEDQGALFGAAAVSSPMKGDATDTAIDACGQCTDCTLFAAGNHPDFHRVHRMLAKLHPEKVVRDRKATMISVDVVRHFLLDPIGLRPSRGRAKVFVIVEAERLSDGAQNAMLKTLEEPPSDSFLILLAASSDSMLATTRSRCQRIGFGTLPTPFIVERLTADGRVDADTAQFLAELSQGSLGLAGRYLELGVYERLDVVCSAVRRAADDPLAASKALQDLAKELIAPLKKYQDDDEGDTNAARDAQQLVLAVVATVLRDAQRMAAGAAPIVRPKSSARAAASAVSPSAMRQVTRAISTAEYQITRNAHTGLIFDSLGIALNRAGVLAI